MTSIMNMTALIIRVAAGTGPEPWRFHGVASEERADASLGPTVIVVIAMLLLLLLLFLVYVLFSLSRSVLFAPTASSLLQSFSLS